MIYSLSSLCEPHYSAECDHAHDDLCEDCKDLDLNLMKIQEKVEAKDWDNKLAIVYSVSTISFIFSQKDIIFPTFHTSVKRRNMTFNSKVQTKINVERQR